jgi:XTP/dITP diphosphohydrolase
MEEMPQRLVLATRNAHKLIELRRILLDAGLEIELVGTDAFPDLPEIAETESTFAGNALLKARVTAQHTGLAAVADDSGLCVDALNGMPGVLSARWSGRGATDASNLQLVLDQLADVPEDRRGANFACAAAMVIPAPDGGIEREFVVEGMVEGMLVREPRGENGFGYDPVFVPQGFTQTTSQMSPDDKDAISHRGIALRALVEVLTGSRG